MIETVIEADDWTRAVPDLEGLAGRCARAAQSFEPELSGEIALLATDDASMQALNHRFRNKTAPTNVLSFPGASASGGAANRFLGDIAIAYETCAREAAAKGVSLGDHAAHLIVHGMLHLIGYDHETVADAESMEAREAEILALLGIANPYADAVETGT
ncbi:MAG: rRNA maturation RNase YbeY [Hyphococcus sp.]